MLEVVEKIVYNVTGKKGLTMVKFRKRRKMKT